MPNIGKLIAEALERMGYTQAQLARELDVTPATVGIWIRNGPPDARITELERIFGPLRPQSEIAQWLRRERNRANLTQKDLGYKAKVSSITISKIETGDTTALHRGTIANLSNALGVPAPGDGEGDYEGDDTPIIESSGKHHPVDTIGDMEDFLPHDENEIRRILNGIGGIYVLLDQNGNAVYVGQSNNIAKRITSRNNGHPGQKWYNERTITSAKYIRIENDAMRRKIEAVLIQLLRPQISKQHN